MKTLLTFLFTTCLLFCFSQNTALEKEVHNVIKNYKVKLHNNPILLDESLSNDSREHSKYMDSINDLVHAEFINSLGEIVQFTTNRDCTDKQLAEKILKNFLNSPPHKEQIHTIHKRMGVGIVVNEKGYVWVTIRFF